MTRRAARHFPDRRAHQHRRRARRWFVVAAVVVLVVPWFGYRAMRSTMEGLLGASTAAGAAAAAADTGRDGGEGGPASTAAVDPAPGGDRPEDASGAGSTDGRALSPGTSRGEAASASAAEAGVGADPVPAPVANPVPLSARGQARVREAARQALLRDPRVGDAGWVDRRELDVVAAAAPPLSSADGAALCAQLAAFGSVDEVVLRVVGAPAAGALHACGASAAVIARSTTPQAPGATAPSRATDLAALRAQVEADTAAAAADAERAARNAESMRVLEERVPEL